MDKEQKARLEDFFTASELVEYLQIPVEEVVFRFSDEIDEAMDDLEELMGVKKETGYE